MGTINAEIDVREDQLKETLAAALMISENDVLSIERMGGLTNQNFKVVTNEHILAARFPGAGTELYLNRKFEKVNTERASSIGVNPRVVYFNETSGLKVIEYVEQAETITPTTGRLSENIRKVAHVFRTLHHSNVSFEDHFDVFMKIEEYENVLNQLKGHTFDDYEYIKAQVLQLQSAYRDMHFDLSPCHNDPLAENFVKNDEGRVYLVDWEFSGMNDAFWDVAAYIIEAGLNEDKEALFLQEYLTGEITNEDLRRLLMNKIFLDFLWSIWALMKVASGEDFLDYAKERYERAKQMIKDYDRQFGQSQI